MRLFRGSVSCGRGTSDCVDFDLFNFQKLSHAQHSEGQEKRHNRPPFNLKSFKFHRLWKTAVLLHFSVVYICNIIHLHNRKLYNSIFFWFRWLKRLKAGSSRLKKENDSVSTLKQWKPKSLNQYHNHTNTKWCLCVCVSLCLCVCAQNALQFIKQCWKMQGRPLFLVLIREDNIK